MTQLRIFLLLLATLTSGGVLAHPGYPSRTDSARDTCLVATKHTSQKLRTQTFFVGDQVVLRLNDHQILRGSIVRIAGKLTIDNRTVAYTDIEWIKRSKPTPSNLIGFGIMTAAGLAFMLSTQDYVMNHDPATETEQLGGTALFFTAGVILLTARIKFRPAQGDVLSVERIQQQP